eukprot:gene29222-38709_t
MKSTLSFFETIAKISSPAEEDLTKDTEAKVLEALSPQNWEISTSLLIEIAAETMDHKKYGIIMGIIWEYLEAETMSWKLIFKSLTLLDFLVKNGTEKVIEACRIRIEKIRSLLGYVFYEGREERGCVIRDKAALLCNLLSSNEMIRSEREKARLLRESFDGLSARSYNNNSSPNSGTSGANYGMENSLFGNTANRHDGITSPPHGFGEDSYYNKASNPSVSSNSIPQVPVKVTDVLNLPSPPMNVPLEYIKFGVCTMESNRCITVCETGQNNLSIINLTTNPASISRQKMKAEAAIMHPTSSIIALRAGIFFQIFNLEARTKVSSCTMSAVVTYWRWISSDTIVLVTAHAVFHWSIAGESSSATPVQVFERNPALENHHVINYQVSDDNKWFLLTGLKSGSTPGMMAGTMQLYNTDKAVTQILQGRSGVFSTIRLTDMGRDDENAQVLCFEDCKPGQPVKLYITEVGRLKTASGGVFKIITQSINVLPNDFPVALHISKENGIINMISKMGFLYLFDIYSGKAIYRGRIIVDTVFVTTIHSATGGMLAITRTGQLIHVEIDYNILVSYIARQLHDQELAQTIASRVSHLSGSDISIFSSDTFNTARVANPFQSPPQAYTDSTAVVVPAYMSQQVMGGSGSSNTSSS